MEELNKILLAAKINPVLTIRDRLNQIQILFSGIEFQNIKISSLDIKIKSGELSNVYSKELKELQAEQIKTLRGLEKNLREQTYLLNQAANEETAESVVEAGRKMGRFEKFRDNFVKRFENLLTAI